MSSPSPTRRNNDSTVFERSAAASPMRPYSGTRTGGLDTSMVSVDMKTTPTKRTSRGNTLETSPGSPGAGRIRISHKGDRLQVDIDKDKWEVDSASGFKEQPHRNTTTFLRTGTPARPLGPPQSAHDPSLSLSRLADADLLPASRSPRQAAAGALGRSSSSAREEPDPSGNGATQHERNASAPAWTPHKPGGMGRHFNNAQIDLSRSLTRSLEEAKLDL